MDQEINSILARLVVIKKLNRLASDLEEIVKTSQARQHTASLIPEPHLTDEAGKLLPEVQLIIQEAKKALNEVVERNARLTLEGKD